jgi:hypothetical protein
MKKLIALSSFLVSISLCTPALAWNKAGHMVSGAIAYNELQAKAPQSLPRVIALLKKHPFYQSKWKAEIGFFCINPRKGGFWKLTRRGLG